MQVNNFFFFNFINFNFFTVILSELGDFRNARAAYKRAFALNSELFVLRLNFAIFEYRRGNILASIRRMGNKLKLDLTKGYEVNLII